MLYPAAKQQRADVDKVIARARTLPADDYDRIPILNELRHMPPKTVLAAAVDLVGAGDTTSKTLAAQVLLGLYWRINMSPLRMRTYRKLVEELSMLDQDPQVLAAALEHFVWIVQPADPKVLLGLLDHADARVRYNAIQAVVKREQLYADESVLSKFIDMLAWDSDPAVRIAAAAALFGIYKDNPDRHGRVGEAIARLRTDSEPEIRCYAIIIEAAGNADAAAAQALDELAAPQPPWQAVILCAEEIDWTQASESARAKVHARLIQLQEQGWARHYVRGKYPNQEDQAEILTQALSAVALQEGGKD